MFDEEVPTSMTRVFGHVCGVIAVAMAALSGFGIWRLVDAASRQHVSPVGFVLVLAAIGITVLFFRWAGVLTGHWQTHGRLSVPPAVYAAFGLLCAVMSLFGVYLIATTPPPSIVWAIVIVIGTLGGAVVARWCFVLVKSQRK